MKAPINFILISCFWYVWCVHTPALLVEVRRRNDVRLIHVKGHSADGGNDRADELAWWGKEGPPFCRLRPGGG